MSLRMTGAVLLGMLVAVMLFVLLASSFGDQQRKPPPPPAFATLLQRVTYELDEHRIESQQIAAEHGLSITTDTARQGRAAGEALLREGDPQYRDRLGYRSEWQSEVRAGQDDEYWYGVSYYLPDDWDEQGTNDDYFNDRIIYQFHEGTGSSPAFSLHLDAQQSRFFVRKREGDGRFSYMASLPFDEERWYDFVFQAKWTHEGNGYFYVYLDGQVIDAYQGPTLVDGESIYTKWGIYGQPTRLFFDEVRIARGPRGLQVVSPAPGKVAGRHQ